MEPIVNILQALQMNAIEVFGVAVLFLGIGYWRGARKANNMQTRIYKLENDILELHAEILYPKEEATVIELGNSSDKKKNIAN